MASKSDKTIPNLENATPSFLIDEIERMRVKASRLKFLDGIYKRALNARIQVEQQKGDVPIWGIRYIGQYTETTVERVDADAVKAELANEPERLRRCMKVGTTRTLRMVPNPHYVSETLMLSPTADQKDPNLDT